MNFSPLVLTDFVETHPGFWKKTTNSKIHYPAEGNSLISHIEDRSFWFRHRNSCICTILSAFPPPLRQILDVGGGNGFVAKAIQNMGLQVTLLEPGAGAEIAYSRGVKTVIQSTLEEFPPMELPSVGLFDVLEHIKDDLSFLEFIASSMGYGERIYITVPAFHILWSGEDETAQHFRRYTLKKLKSTLVKAGFSIEFGSYFFSFLPFPIFLQRTLPFLLGCNKQEELKISEKEHSFALPALLDVIFKNILAWENKSLKARVTIPFGGSILIAARKK
ncbi:MAG: methyltransferase domain-containing protein [Candidatus Ozemobacteraceae bacterium]